MKNKMIKRSHLSEKKCRELIQLFSEDLTATQIANITGVSRVTINNYLKLIRTQIARYCEERNPYYTNGYVDGLLQDTNGYKKNEQLPGTAMVEPLHAHYGFFRHSGSVFTDGLPQVDKNDIEVLQQIRFTVATDKTNNMLMKYQAIADFENWRLYRVDTSHIVNGKNELDDIAVFWGHTKSRLIKFRGLNKSTLYLHVKECEFRYNNRTSDINALLLNIMYHQPLRLSKYLVAQ
jgi:transposase